MIIKCPNGKEITLTWAGRVSTWEISFEEKPSLKQQTNDSGLVWLFSNNDGKRKADPHAATRCIKDYGWVCPHGSAFPCISKKKSSNQHLAAIDLSNWERRQGYEPDGKQLTLFKRGYWYNTKTGETRWTNEERPYSQADIVCKEMAVASMEWLKRKMGWNPLKWRIIPIDDDMQWTNDMQVKHSGQYKQCIFDIWD